VLFYLLPSSCIFLYFLKLYVLSSVVNRSYIKGADSNTAISTHVHGSPLCVRVFLKLVTNLCT
jgi:hypothetical protein